jgi:hypothetical protein
LIIVQSALACATTRAPSSSAVCPAMLCAPVRMPEARVRVR